MTEQTAELIFLRSSRRRRFAAFAIDHYIITFLMLSIVFIAAGEDFVNENNPDKMFTVMMLVMIPWLFLYFAKDSLKGISIGKWMMGIKVRDERIAKTVVINRLLEMQR